MIANSLTWTHTFLRLAIKQHLTATASVGPEWLVVAADLFVHTG